MSASAPQTEAARKAAARKAKILARGNSGLNQLAQTARGDEASTLYGQEASSSRSPTSPAPTSPGNVSSSAPPASSTTNGFPPSQSTRSQPSAEQAAMSSQLEAMMSMLGGSPTPNGTGGMPDMQQLMAQMMGMDPSAGLGASVGGQDLVGDLDDSAGLGGSMAGSPMNPFNLPGATNGGFPAFPGMQTVRRKSKVERYFPLIHAVSIAALLVFVVAWWEPSLKSTRWGVRNVNQNWAGRWAGLAGRKGIWRGIKDDISGGVQMLPIFWAFSTLELILQTTRFFILNSPPPPHSLISTFLPLMPPTIARPLVTGSRYLTLLAQMYKDGCLLVFGVGMLAVLAEWLEGRSVLS